MSKHLPTLVIEGITLEGVVFRPSDWIERLISTLASYGEDRRQGGRPYHGIERRQENFVQAQMINSRKCLVVDCRLRESNPAAYHFLQEFIQNNRLQTGEWQPAPDRP